MANINTMTPKRTLRVNGVNETQSKGRLYQTGLKKNKN